MKPIAWYDPSNGVVSTDQDCPLFTPLGQVWGLYPQREWVGLTDDEVAQLMFRCDVIVTGPTQFNFARAIEARLKEKNT